MKLLLILIALIGSAAAQKSKPTEAPVSPPAAMPVPAEEAALYIQGKLSPARESLVAWSQVPKEQWPAVIDAIAARKTLTGADARAVWEMTRNAEKWPQLAPRADEIVAFYDPATMNRYKMKYTKLMGLKGNTSFVHRMTPQEIMTVTTGTLTAIEFDWLKQEVLARCTAAMKRTRSAGNLPNDAQSFATAMAPILTALDAPMWHGLAAATEGLGMDFTPPNYTKLGGDLDRKSAAFDGKTIPSVERFAGSMVFRKGVAGFAEWSRGRQAIAGARPPAAPVEAPLVKAPAGKAMGMKGVIQGDKGEAMVKDPEALKAIARSNQYDRVERSIQKAAAPLSDFAVKFQLWGPPHGAFMTKLRADILKADAAGDIAERDRLMALYQPWAEKYLNADSTAWSREKLRPGVKVEKIARPPIPKPGK